MKILVISRTPWRLDNSFGNTYSSIFSKIDDIEIAHIYLADGFPEPEAVVKKYFQVSESKVIRTFFKKRTTSNAVGCEVLPSVENKTILDSTVTAAQKIRLPLFYIIRDFLWHYGNINYDGMESFARDFKPDLIFAPLYYAKYVSRVIIKLQKALNIPLVLECSLDVYSLHQVSFDPFYWINRLSVRHTIRKVIKKTSLLYTISDMMRTDYEKMLGVPCKILYKFPDLSRGLGTYKRQKNKPIHFLYTGNIGDGRWKTLSKLGMALKENKFGILDVYTATPITEEIKAELEIDGFSTVHNPVSQKEVIKLQGEADILVHAESFEKKNKLLVRYSISTKIMDYLCAGRTIFAIGPNDIASIEFLKLNNLALCASSDSEISDVVTNLKQFPEQIDAMSVKGLDYVLANLDASKMRKDLFNELKYISENEISSISKKQ